VGDVVGPQARVDGDQHGPDVEHGERRLDPLGAVEHPERDPVAGSDAERDQPTRHAVDAGRDLGEGPAPVAEAERLARPPAAGRPPDQRAEGGRLDGGRRAAGV